MARTLVLVRHAKSDWSVPVDDRERPLAARGRRQAPASGRWIAVHLDPPDLAVVSVATRAQQTWELVSAELPHLPPARVEPAAYTFDGDALLDVVRDLPADAATVVVVSHNPALEELVTTLTGQAVRMRTSAIAVITLPAWDSASGKLQAAGRPADEELGYLPR